MRWLAVLAMTAVAGLAQDPRDFTPEQEAILKSAKTFALQYTKSLPDFICTQTVQRSEDTSNNGRWRNVDTLTVKLSYAGREEYKLMARNGATTEEDYSKVGGTTSSGEFG